MLAIAVQILSPRLAGATAKKCEKAAEARAARCDTVAGMPHERPQHHQGPGVAAALGGEGATLRVRGYRYEYPDLQTGEDANWVSADAELLSLRAGRYVGRMTLSLRTEELASFVAELRRLDADLTGQAELSHLEDGLGATVKLTNGVGTLDAVLRTHVQAELRITEVRTGQTYVRRALAEFEALSQAFPVRGEPFASR